MTYNDVSNRLYIGNACKSLFVMDPDSAEIVWQTDATYGIFLGSPTCPAICGDVIVGRANWAGTFGYDAKTGKTLWVHKLGNAPTAKERHRLAEPRLECVGFPGYRNGLTAGRQLVMTGLK